MSFFVNASQEEAFRLVMDYFNGRRMKILSSNSPSYIRAKFGKVLALETSGNAKGEAKTNIMKRNGGSYVNLDLDFFEYYLTSFVATAIFAVVAVIIYQMLELPFWLSLIILPTMALVALVGAGYSVSNTRKRITQEFNMFIQSLASKKD
jgi:uncharacterized membrane protein